MLHFNWRFKMRHKLSGKSVSEPPNANRNDMATLGKPIKANDCSGLQHRGFKKAHKVGLSMLAALIVGSMNACTYKSPATEEPVPVESDIPKSFFVKTELDKKTGKTINVPKKFLCGWASEMEVGQYAEWFYTNNAIVPEHCNLVFDITENALVGKLINPSFPNEPSRWEIVLSIPIASHHYVEREKDNAGRETNRVVRNSSRSHWSARPNMILDLNGIHMDGRYRSAESWYGTQRYGNIKVTNVDWDMKSGFLGMTLEKGTGDGDYSRIRFNIKEFETKPEFKTTPFNDKNYKYMNVLHIIGEKVKGLYPILSAAHWDVSKKIEIRLWQVPEKYRDVVKEVVSDWNEVFHKAGVTTVEGGPFSVSETPAEHAFDLRYPTIAWVSDDKISSYSPLGIGMALADVTNGEIKWGMITLYGGYIETYMKSYLETTSSSTLTGKIARLANSLSNYIKKPESVLQIPFVKNILSANVSDGLVTDYNANSALFVKDKKGEKKENVAQYLGTKNLLEGILAKNKMAAQNLEMELGRRMSAKNVTSIVGSSFLNSKNAGALKQEKGSDEKADHKLTPENFRETLQKKYASPLFCQDRLIEDMVPGWNAALNKTKDSAGELANDDKILRHMVKELITHEYGHLMGLGHQFKESILPSKDSVPETAYNALAEKANAKNHYTNYSSVMGYRNPRTELSDDSVFKPGPHDELVIRYLYKQQYATFKKGDADFSFADIPADGIIPVADPAKPEFKTSYFPQCNDLDASYGFDPYCNRFDTGYNATSIVQSYFDDVLATLPQTLVAFTDARGGDYQEAEGRLWMRSLNTLSRVRTFYDYMRVYYKEQFDQIRQNEDALMNFSLACRETNVENIKQPELKKIFSEKPELADLCRANALALENMKKIVKLKGPDHTKVDIKTHISPGGMNGGDAGRDYSQILGTWKELSVFPLKYASLMALTEPSPWIMMDGWMMPNFLYNTPQTLFSYMYIYPREYTDVLASNIKENLQFAGMNGAEKTSIGRSILSMMWMNYIANTQNRDAGLFPAQYVTKIRNQQNFNVGVVALILKGASRDNGQQDRVVRWDGSLYDFAADKSIALNSAFVLPKGKIVATASNMLLYPVTDFTPFSAKDGYAFAYKLEINQSNQPDGLSDLSAKKDIADHNERLLYSCLNGQDNGLKNFFAVENLDFQGFEMGQNLERSDEMRKRFLDSIDEAFNLYYSNTSPSTKKTYFTVAPRPDTCMETLRGIGLLINTGAIMNGYYFPEIYDYLQ